MNVAGRALHELKGGLLGDPGGEPLVPPQIAVAQSPNAQAECQQQDENQKVLVTFQRTVLGTASIKRVWQEPRTCHELHEFGELLVPLFVKFVQFVAGLAELRNSCLYWSVG